MVQEHCQSEPEEWRRAVIRTDGIVDNRLRLSDLCGLVLPRRDEVCAGLTTPDPMWLLLTTSNDEQRKVGGAVHQNGKLP